MKVLTWNVQWFCGLDGVISIERVLRDARTLADFDVLCLQEVAVNYPGLRGNAGFDQVQRVRELLPGFQVGYGAAIREHDRERRPQRFGNLIASRLPVAHELHQLLPSPADAGVRSMPRLCVAATLQAPWGPLRVMTTHLEYYSAPQRLAQVQALLALHAQCCAHAAVPRADDAPGWPLQGKTHSASALLCGDFNLPPQAPEYALLQQAPAAPATRFVDAWTLAHPEQDAATRTPTFCVYERTYGPEPFACDVMFVTEDLMPRVRSVEVDLGSRASDHQPLVLTLE